MAQRYAAGSRVAYVDIDDVAVLHAKALLAKDAQTCAVKADLRQPRDLLGNQELRSLIDLEKPVAILLLTTLHFIPEGDDPAGIVGQLRDAMAPGSYLVISHAEVSPAHAVGQEWRSEQVKVLADAYSPSQLAPARDRAGIARFFDSFELVEPGLIEVWDWRPTSKPVVSPSSVMTPVGGVARKV